MKFPETFKLVVPAPPFIFKVPPLKEKLPATFMIQSFDPPVPAIKNDPPVWLKLPPTSRVSSTPEFDNLKEPVLVLVIVKLPFTVNNSPTNDKFPVCDGQFHVKLPKG